MRLLARLALLALVAAAAIPSRADCEQCAIKGLEECQTLGESVFCRYLDGSVVVHDRVRSTSFDIEH